METRLAKFQIGQIVRHRFYLFSNTEEWYESIPEEIRPRKDQPYYHLFAENEETTYVAYVSEQNLVPDDTQEPVRHPEVLEVFSGIENGCYVLRNHQTN